MASSIIHLAIAKELKNNLKIEDEKDYYLGSIAPDISKQIGQDRSISHFIINTRKDIPNIDIFVKRYPTFKYNSFDLGYFIHLYTDKLWNEKIHQALSYGNSMKLLDGTIINSEPDEYTKLIYSDYTNLNTLLIDEYNLNLSLFYEDLKIPNTIISEIPIEKLDILINKMSIIIENSKQEKNYIVNIDIIKNFINDTVKEILEELEKY